MAPRCEVVVDCDDRQLGFYLGADHRLRLRPDREPPSAASSGDADRSRRCDKTTLWSKATRMQTPSFGTVIWHEATSVPQSAAGPPDTD